MFLTAPQAERLLVKRATVRSDAPDHKSSEQCMNLTATGTMGAHAGSFWVIILFSAFSLYLVHF